MTESFRASLTNDRVFITLLPVLSMDDPIMSSRFQFRFIKPNQSIYYVNLTKTFSSKK